jgi:undecaprenyl phosphate N,N'-diacetylbacillosamine 1-phosphate transferase
MKKTLYSLYFKRFIDFNLALFALIVLSPLLILVIFLQVIFNGLPIFFTQKRIGKGEKIFKLIKFRTMNYKTDKFGNLLPDIQRKTLFGSLLRSTSIDELPSLINILKGDMAVIGPRPLLIEYLPLYNEQHKRRHFVRPGLSGLAQINGRNKLSWLDKFKYDVKYVEKISLKLDIYIILMTIVKVVTQEGIENSKSTIIDKFNGKN